MSYPKYGTTFGEFVRRFREEMGLSQVDLAKEIGVHAQYISNIERDVYPNPLRFAKRIKPLMSGERAEYMKDLFEEMQHERLARLLEGPRGERRRSAKSARRISQAVQRS